MLCSYLFNHRKIAVVIVVLLIKHPQVLDECTVLPYGKEINIPSGTIYSGVFIVLTGSYNSVSMVAVWNARTN